MFIILDFLFNKIHFTFISKALRYALIKIMNILLCVYYISFPILNTLICIISFYLSADLIYYLTFTLSFRNEETEVACSQ